MIPTLEIGYFTVVVWKSIVKFNGVLSKRGLGDKKGRETQSQYWLSPHIGEGKTRS